MSRPIVFETERLVAREWSLDDAEAAFDMYRRPEVVRYIGGELQDSLDKARAKIEFLIERNAGWPEGYGSFPMFLKSDDLRMKGVGVFKFLPDVDDEPTEDTEIGWHLHPDLWGRGYATEIGLRLVQHGFETLGVSELHAVVVPENLKSCAVARRLGMQPTGRTSRYYGGLEVEHFLLRREDV